MDSAGVLWQCTASGTPGTWVSTDPSSKVSKAGDTMTGTLSVPMLQFDITGAVATHAEGQVHWNPVDHTLDLHPDVTNATLQVGQESWLRVTNKTGVTLTDGQVVYIEDAQGNRPTVALANASATSTTACRTIGVITADILANAEGYVVTFGLLREFNTSGFTDGEELFVNPAVPGGITNVRPVAPAHCVRVGYALNSTNNGMLFISPHFVGDLPRQNAATKEPTGFESPELITVAYDSTARTVTMTQAGSITYWFRGVRYTLASPWTSAAHTATNGPWFLMFGVGGTFSWAQTPWSLENDGPVCYVNYNTPTGVTFAVREVHGLMPWQAHLELHEQIGTYRRSGGMPTAGTYVLDTNTNAAITPGFDAAVVADEDLPSTIPALTEGSYTHLRVAAGSVSAFRLAEPYLLRTTGTYPNWNDATTGAETEAAANRFLNVYQVLVPVTSEAGSQAYRMLFVQPQASFTTLAAAQAEDFRSLSLGSLSSLAPEFCAFSRLTFSTAAANSTVGKVRLSAIAYLTGPRSSQVVTSATTPASHTVLADRSDPDQHPASSITNTPAGSIAATTVQGAINELDTSKVDKPVSSTLAYNPNGTLNTVTTADGTKTMAYNPNGSLASITGTGAYGSKTFTYDGGGALTGVTVS